MTRYGASWLARPVQQVQPTTYCPYPQLSKWSEKETRLDRIMRGPDAYSKPINAYRTPGFVLSVCIHNA